MNLYSVDFGWRGSIVIAANSVEEAWKVFQRDKHPAHNIPDTSEGWETFNDKADLISAAIPGIIHYDLGDS